MLIGALPVVLVSDWGFRHLHRIPGYHILLECIYAQAEFDEQMDNVEAPLNGLGKWLTSIRDSEEMKVRRLRIRQTVSSFSQRQRGKRGEEGGGGGGGGSFLPCVPRHIC